MATRSPQDITSRARRVLDAALSVTGRWPREPEVRQVVRQAADDLDTALDNFQAVESRAVTWECFYPHLSAVADPHGEALEKLADEAVYAMGSLYLAVTATCGKELADAIKDVAAGNQNGPQISPAGRAECTASADATPTNQGVHQ